MKRFFIIIFLVAAVGLLIPQTLHLPVAGASKSSYSAKSFWYYPWGKSVTHKGVDIFAKEGVNVKAATSGIAIYSGKLEMGGNIVLMLGPKWRLHYYAHLESITTEAFEWRTIDEKIGTVGTSGNAKGKPPHLHYSIITMVPYVWRIDNSIQGWKKMFYLNPIEYFGS
jgi:peptidoglycan LD-endopeptidase LytH